MTDIKDEAAPHFGRNSASLSAFLITENAPSSLSEQRFSLVLNVPIDKIEASARLRKEGLDYGHATEHIQCYLRDCLRVIEVAAEISLNVEGAIEWFKTKQLAMFGNKTPHDLVCANRTDDVVRYLVSQEAGFAG